MIYPWLQSTLDELTDRYARERLPHALLLSGPKGVGKLGLARVLAAVALCVNQNACGECKACLLREAGSHPDLRMVELEDDAKQIKIEQVRDLIDWVNQTAQMNGSKVSIVSPAHKMNRSSANALLKIMEEPPARNYILLVTDEPAMLLPTIRSRAQNINVSIPESAAALSWLRSEGGEAHDWPVLLGLSNGSPLLALERADEEYLARRISIARVWGQLWTGQAEVVTLVASLAKVELVEILEMGIAILADVSRFHASGDKKDIKNKDIASIIEDVCSTLERRQALACERLLMRDYRLAKGSQNPNQALLLEALMSACIDVTNSEESSPISL